jgi:signal transduction histidine kinase
LAGADSLVVLAVDGEAGPFMRGRVIPAGVGVLGLCGRARAAIASPNVLAEPRITLTSEMRAGFAAAGLGAMLAAPMVVQDRLIGVLAVGDRPGRAFSDEETRLAGAFADQVALALELGRLYEEADRRRREAEAAERRAAFLNEATRVLGATLEYETALGRLAQLVVPELADLCTIDLEDATGSVRRVAAVAAGGATADLARECEARYAADRSQSRGALDVLRTGRSAFHPLVSDDVLAAIARDGGHHGVLRTLGIQSVMVVPLIARERVLGAITLATAASGRHYTLADLAFAEEFGRRIAQAVDTARLCREARDANRAKDDFLALVSHELRTPLTAIQGWARVLRTQPLDEETRVHGLETIERNARAQAQIVDDLLDVSRVITGKLRLNMQPVDLVRVIEHAVESVKPAVDAKGLVLTCSRDPDTGPFVGDPDRLQQVAWNLLSNAVKFTPPGGRIDVTLRRSGAHVEIAVRDTGPGIRREFLPYVFDRFRQAADPPTRSVAGLGLGLAIVRHVVELHGGTVHAESEGEGRGATFTVRLPLAAAPVPAVAPLPSPPAAAAARLRGRDVLVLEADEEERRVFGAVLEAAGARVTAVASAAAASVALDARPYAVLVCGAAARDEDGEALIRRLRAQGARLPAVLLAASAGPDDRERALRAGFDAHVTKPVEPNALVAVVTALVRTLVAA